MKKMNYALAGALMLAMPCTVMAAGHYEITEIASFDGTEKDIYIFSDAPTIEDANRTGRYLAGINGDQICDIDFSDISVLGKGLYVGHQLGADNLNSAGLISDTEGLLIPCEAALINTIRGLNTQKSEKYVIVYYITEETTNEDECFLYYSKSYNTFGPEEGDTMFKGCAKIFDLNAKAFVPNIEIIRPVKYDLCEFGGNIAVPENDKITIYNENGEVVFEKDGNARVCKNSLILRTDDGFELYDTELNKVYETENWLSTVDSKSEYVAEELDEETNLLDAKGNVVASTDGYIHFASGDLMIIDKENEETGEDEESLIRISDGTVLTTAERVEYETMGIFSVENEDDLTQFFTVDGPINAQPLDGYGFDLFLGETNSDDDMISALILNDGSFVDISMYDSTYTVEPGLLYVSSMDQDQCGLVDLFTGETLLDVSYDYIHKIGERIFARTDDTWTVYEVNFVQ